MRRLQELNARETRSVKKARTKEIPYVGVFPLDVWRIIVDYCGEAYRPALFMTNRFFALNVPINYGSWRPYHCMETYANDGHWNLIAYAIANWCWVMHPKAVTAAQKNGQRIPLRPSMESRMPPLGTSMTMTLVWQHDWSFVKHYTPTIGDAKSCTASKDMKVIEWVLDHMNPKEREREWYGFLWSASEHLGSDDTEKLALKYGQHDPRTCAKFVMAAAVRDGNLPLFSKILASSDESNDHFVTWASKGRVDALEFILANRPNIVLPNMSALTMSIKHALEAGHIATAQFIVQKCGFATTPSAYRITAPNCLDFFMNSFLGSRQSAINALMFTPATAETIDWWILNAPDSLPKKAADFRVAVMNIPPHVRSGTGAGVIRAVVRFGLYRQKTVVGDCPFEYAKFQFLAYPRQTIDEFVKQGVPIKEIHDWTRTLHRDKEFWEFARIEEQNCINYLECFDLAPNVKVMLRDVKERAARKSDCLPRKGKRRRGIYFPDADTSFSHEIVQLVRLYNQAD